MKKHIGFYTLTGAMAFGAFLGAFAVTALTDYKEAIAAEKKGIVEIESFDHIGFVVEDSDAVVELWTELFGLGPWRRVYPEQGPMRKMSWVRIGGTQFELLEPNETKSHWSDHLAKHGDGIHHVCMLTDTVESDVEHLTALENTEVIASSPGFAYVKTEGVGNIILEVLATRASATNSY
mgnify:CR=1 FL=1|jgi:catechol 2,3-dioxygenase-like lactoylglutathione lyase family enzyme